MASSTTPATFCTRMFVPEPSWSSNCGMSLPVKKPDGAYAYLRFAERGLERLDYGRCSGLISTP